MTDDKGIFIKNIFYMLTYAFQVLKQTNYEKIASEAFEKIQDLSAAILAKGISQQLKQGLYREYVTHEGNLSVMRGKLDIQNTLKNRIQQIHRVACIYDELSENNIYNQILKTTVTMLIRERSVAHERKQALKDILRYFYSTETVNPAIIRWNTLRLRKNNESMQMLINMCFFVLKDLLLTTEKGRYRIASFSDEHMARLFEKFVLEYYKSHHSHLEACPAQIHWNLDGNPDESVLRLLPQMKTDITLRYQGKTLIIDTKYYMRILQSQFDTNKLHSNNLYQIFTYVKNKDVQAKGNVSGLLLYAKTDETIATDCSFSMRGNRISVKNLDLNKEFKYIAAQLDAIAEAAFGGR